MSIAAWWKSLWSEEARPSPPHCLVFKDIGDHWRYSVRGANGAVMLTSEAYDNYGNAVRAAEALVRNPPRSIEVRS